MTATSTMAATHSPIVVGGVDTHKDLHVAAVVDSSDRVLGVEFFSTTRAGYRAMLAWMRTFGDIRRVGVECTGPTVRACCASSRPPVSRSWKSPRRIAPIDTSAVRMTPWMPRAPPTPRSPASAPSLRSPAMGWWIAAGVEDCPQNSGVRATDRVADAALPDRVRTRGATRPGPQPHPDATDTHRSRVAPRPAGFSATPPARPGSRCDPWPVAHDAADVALFTQHAADAIAVEQHLHTSLLSELGVNPDMVLEAEAGPATTAYIDHLLATCATGSFSDGLAAVLPCYWIYAQVGQRLLARSSPDPRYARWISTYAGPAFADTVGAVLDVADRVGERLSNTSARRAEHLNTVHSRHE